MKRTAECGEEIDAKLAAVIGTCAEPATEPGQHQPSAIRFELLLSDVRSSPSDERYVAGEGTFHWSRIDFQSAEWQEEEQTLLASLRELERAGNPERALDPIRILELANKAHSLYVTQTPQDIGRANSLSIAEHSTIRN